MLTDGRENKMHTELTLESPNHIDQLKKQKTTKPKGSK